MIGRYVKTTINQPVLENLRRKFESHFDARPEVLAYAPGRIEVLGNHTDYNEGLVLSAAIHFGTFFAVRPSTGKTCRLVAGDLMEETGFPVVNPQPVTQPSWSNYVRGVMRGLLDHVRPDHGFDAMFLGNIPLGAGLSSSAALEMSAALALCRLYGVDHLSPHDLAKIGQQAEHEFAGVKCGLLDQISSLFGREGHLVQTDFRTLEVQTVPMGADACMLMCNTAVKHQLVDSAYNERRQACETAAQFFAEHLDHPVTHLRDVHENEFEQFRCELDTTTARRAAHVIGEIARVQAGTPLIRQGDLAAFGNLMFASHESSRVQFENSCEELDFIVATARDTAGIYGARLSGGGFGGSAVLLTSPSAAEPAGRRIQAAYASRFGHPCDIAMLHPGHGAYCL